MDDVHTLPARHKLDVDAYHRMAEAGVFGPEERVELIEGDLIDMAPIGQGHAGIVTALTYILSTACAGRALVSPQNPVRLDRLSEPQPDFAVLRWRDDFYVTGERPSPADTILLIEVAESSLRFDREVKLPLYARAGIAEFWLVDLRQRVIEVYRWPEAGAYLEKAVHAPGDRIALALMPEIVVTLGLVFG